MSACYIHARTHTSYLFVCFPLFLALFLVSIVISPSKPPCKNPQVCMPSPSRSSSSSSEGNHFFPSHLPTRFPYAPPFPSSEVRLSRVIKDFIVIISGIISANPPMLIKIRPASTQQQVISGKPLLHTPQNEAWKKRGGEEEIDR